MSREVKNGAGAGHFERDQRSRVQRFVPDAGNTVQIGAIYVYYFVPEEVHRELMNAASHGTYLNQNIKAVYEYKRIAEPHDVPKKRRKKPGAGVRPPGKRR